MTANNTNNKLKNLFRPYQKEWIKDRSRFKIAVKARQIGFSFAEGYSALSGALAGRNQFVVSSSWIQGKYFMHDKIRPWADKYRLWYESKTGRKFKFERSGQTTLVLPNNVTIMVLPPVPESIASFSGDVHLDEFARYKKSAEVYSAIKPSIDAGFNISIFSSPYGAVGKFPEIFKEVERYPQYKRYHVDIYEAIKQGLRKRDGSEYDVEELKLDSDFFNQEYLCQFEAGGFGYYDDVLILSCIYEDQEHDEFNDRLEERKLSGANYMGVDVGFSVDKTCIVVYTVVDGILYERDKRILDKNVVCDNGLNEYDINNQKDIVLEYYGKYKPHVCRIDMGVGGYPLWKMLKNYIEIEGIQMSPKWKMEAGGQMKKLMAQGKFKIKDDETHIKNIQSCYVVGKEGSQTLDFKRWNGYHGDICSADWLATYNFVPVKTEIPFEQYELEML